MDGYNHRAPGQPWSNVVIQQEEFNSGPENYGVHPDQFGNRYNYEDGEESDTGEEAADGEEEKDNK